MRNELGKKIRKLREERGYTPKYLAGKIGVSESAYRSYENGSRKPDADKIVKIAKVLGVSPNYLLEDYPKNLDELEELRDRKSRKLLDITRRLQLEPLNEDLVNELKQLQLEIENLDKEIFSIDAQLSLKRIPILKNISDIKKPIPESIGHYFAQDKSVDCAVYVPDDSLMEKGIFNNALLLVERTEKAHPGDLVIASVDNSITIRFLQDINGSLYLCPANKNHQNIPVIPGKVRILGVVRGYYTPLINK